MNKLSKEHKIIMVVICVFAVTAFYIIIFKQESSRIKDLKKSGNIRKEMSEEIKILNALYPAISSDAKDIKLFRPDLNGDGLNDVLVSYNLAHFLKEYVDKNIYYNPYDYYVNVFLWVSKNKKFIRLKQHEPAGLLNINNSEILKPNSVIIKDFDNDNKDELFLKKEIDDVEDFQISSLLNYSEDSGELKVLPYNHTKITEENIFDVYKKAGREYDFTEKIKNRIMNQILGIGPYKANEIRVHNNIITTTHYTHEESEVLPWITNLIPSGPAVYIDWIMREERIYPDKIQIEFMEAGVGVE